MRFILIDRFVRIEPGRSAKAIKNVSLAEEYLADHFPTFPVLPGVLMLEAMTQTSAYLVRVTEDFAHSLIVLRQAKNVSYSNFVAPGGTMEVETEMLTCSPQQSTFKTQCSMGGANVARARLELQHANLADRYSDGQEQDAKLREHFRAQFKLLAGPEAIVPEKV